MVLRRPELFEVGEESLLAGFVELREGDFGGAEVSAEEVDGAGGVGGEIELEREWA